MDELPQWQCHKKVRAAKVIEVTREQGDNAPYSLRLEGDHVRYVDQNWAKRHGVWDPGVDVPKLAGGFFVEYEDGYSSWSPPEAFEAGYTLIAK